MTPPKESTAHASALHGGLLNWFADAQISWLSRPIADFPWFRWIFYPLRSIYIAIGALPLAYIATFRHFGFDADTTLMNYPGNVAEGWGLWAWLARQRLAFSVFFLVVNFALAVLMLTLTLPRQDGASPKYPAVRAAAFLFMTVWFLFGQARYGTAVALVSIAIAGDAGIVAAIFLWTIAILIHKAIAGGAALLLVWLLLRKRKLGVPAALSICLVGSSVITWTAQRLLAISGYSDYLNWQDWQQTPGTPYKYLCFGLVLIVWFFAEKSAEVKGTAKELLILTLLFFPSSLLDVLAGRGYVLYAVVVLVVVVRRAVPWYARCFFLSAYLFEVCRLLLQPAYFNGTWSLVH